MPNPSRNEIYEATINRMVDQALLAQERQFDRDHAQDTELQLAAYLRECAHRLEHTPWPREIVGGITIRDRFGSWEAALEAAALPHPVHPDRISRFVRIREETERQKMVYRERKARKKQRAQERMRMWEEKQRKARG